MSDMTIEEALKVANDSKNSCLPRGEALQKLSDEVGNQFIKIESLQEINNDLNDRCFKAEKERDDMAEKYNGLFKVAHDLQMEVKQLRKSAAGEWLDYPEHKPERNVIYLCLVSDVFYKELCHFDFENNLWSDPDYQFVDVRRFAEIRT